MIPTKTKLEENIESIKKGELGFFILPELNEDKQKENILRHLSNLYGKGIYLSFKLNAEEAQKHIDDLGLNEQIYVAAKKGNKKSFKGLSAFDNDVSLTQISGLIEKLSKTGKYEFIVLDSISTLLLHNDSRVVSRFLKIISLHNNKLYLTCIAADSEATSMLSQRIADSSKIFTNFEFAKNRLIGENTSTKQTNSITDITLKSAFPVDNLQRDSTPEQYRSELSSNSLFGSPVILVGALLSFFLGIFLYVPNVSVNLSPGIEPSPWYVLNWMPIGLVIVGISLLFLFLKNKN